MVHSKIQYKISFTVATICSHRKVGLIRTAHDMVMVALGMSAGSVAGESRKLPFAGISRH